MPPKKMPKGPRPVAQNRRARHDFDVLHTFECGMELAGSQVKSPRDGKVQLRAAFVRGMDGDYWHSGGHEARYAHANGSGALVPYRPRMLLHHRHEIAELHVRTSQEGLTLVPLSIYFIDGRAKLELAVARGRKTYDKRHAIAERDAEREARRSARVDARGE